MLLKKIFVIFILLQGFLFFTLSVKAAPLPAAVNPICWTLEGCESQLKETYPKESFDSKYNFRAGGINGECKDTKATYGLCIPGQKVKAQIRIGNFDVFENMADFFQKYFIYAVSIGGFIAACILVMAGFMWATSAGIPERITQAKSYITSSLTGLVLLLGSYTLLYTINPDLVRFRLPMVYMLRPIVAGAEWCKDLQGANTMVAKAGDKKSSSEVGPASFNILANKVYTLDELKTRTENNSPFCDVKYFWKDSNDNTCRGNVCKALSDGTPSVCSNVKSTSVGSTYACKKGILTGSVVSPDNVIPYPFLDTLTLGGGSVTILGKSGSIPQVVVQPGLMLAALCKGKNLAIVANAKVLPVKKDVQQEYLFESAEGLSNPVVTGCTKDQLGFFLIGRINDKFLNNSSVATSDFQPIGKTGNGICSTNIFQAAGEKPTTIVFSGFGGLTTTKATDDILLKSFDKIKSNMFTLDELQMGTICDIEILRSDFPSL